MRCSDAEEVVAETEPADCEETGAGGGGGSGGELTGGAAAELGVLITVFGAMVSIFYAFAGRRKVDR